MTLATHDAIEGVALPTKIEALQRVESAIQHHDGFWGDIIWLAENHAWESLDYESFDALWDDRFAGLGVGLGRKIRARVVIALRVIGQSHVQIQAKTGVSRPTIQKDLANVKNLHSLPDTITNSRGEERPTNYATKPAPIVPEPETIPAEMEEDMPATLAHKTPYKPGHVLATDSKGYDVVIVGDDGTATATRPSNMAALEYARANPREPQYEAIKNSGMSNLVIKQAYSALRRNGEIPEVAGSGRKPADEFALIAMAIKNLGLSIDKLIDEGTLDYVDAEDTDYYMPGLRDGMKSIKRFAKAANDLHGNK